MYNVPAVNPFNVIVPSEPRHVVGPEPTADEITGDGGSDSVSGPTEAALQLTGLVTLIALYDPAERPVIIT